MGWMRGSDLLSKTISVGIDSIYSADNIHPNCYVIECLEKISVNEREMTIGI